MMMMMMMMMMSRVCNTDGQHVLDIENFAAAEEAIHVFMKQGKV